MKKTFTLSVLAILVALFSVSKSYSQAYEKGDKLLNVGLGLNSYYYGTPIGASFEYGLTENISAGVAFDYNSGKDDAYYSQQYSASYIGLRGSYHLNEALNISNDKIDTYVGLGIGSLNYSLKDKNSSYKVDRSTGLYFNYFLGGKYYFSEKLGGFLELGVSGLSNSRIGLAVKF